LPSLVQDPSNQLDVLAAMPNAVAPAGARASGHDLAFTRTIGPTGDELSRRLLFQPDTGLPGVGLKSPLDLLMLGGDAIGEALEAEHVVVVIDGVVNGRVGFEGVLEPRGSVSGALRRPWRLQRSSGRRVV
jgi:hypothetical protein